jgi:hypothetical protein
MQYILRVAPLIPLLVIGVLIWQIYRKFKSIPEDEIVGEERAKYMRQRLTWIAICAGLTVTLQITSIILRIFEII